MLRVPTDNDRPHLVGRRHFLGGLGAGLGLVAVGDAPRVFGLQQPNVSVPSGASKFVALSRQTRLADTRQPENGTYSYTRLRSANGKRIRVQVAGRDGIPETATAATLTVTAINLAGFNFVSVYPSGVVMPDVSNLNMQHKHQVFANLVTVQLGDDGAVELQSHSDCDLIVDVVGTFVPSAGPVRAGRYVGLEIPRRIFDSRSGHRDAPGARSISAVDVSRVVPSDATAVMINLTLDGAKDWGFLTCYPFGEREVPDSSNLNVESKGQARAAAAVVPVGEMNSIRGFNVWSYGGGHIIVDLLGYFTGPESGESSEGLFVPALPERIVDTRQPSPHRLWHNWMLESPVPREPATGASSVLLNVTADDSLGWGYLYVSPARTYKWSPSVYPVSSNLNYTERGTTLANQVVTRITENSGFSVYSYGGSHVIVDYFGYFTGSPRSAAVGAPDNPAPQAVGPEWTLKVPALNLESRVRDGDSVVVTDEGDTWHWTGTGDMGQSANVALFAHRTSAGGPLRNVHRLVAGDRVEIVTSDRRTFEYEVVERLLTSSDRDEILAASRSLSTTSVSLIACSKENFLPTSLDHRIVVNAKLVRWYEW